MVAMPGPTPVTRPLPSTDATDGASLPHTPAVTGCVAPVLIVAVAVKVSAAPMNNMSEDEVIVMDCATADGADGVLPPPHAVAIKDKPAASARNARCFDCTMMTSWCAAHAPRYSCSVRRGGGQGWSQIVDCRLSVADLFDCRLPIEIAVCRFCESPRHLRATI